MQTQENRNPENRNRSVAAKAGNAQEQAPAFGYVDNRPEALQLKNLQTIANNSPQTRQLARLQKISHPVQSKAGTECAGNQSQAPVQRVVNVDNKDKNMDRLMTLAQWMGGVPLYRNLFKANDYTVWLTTYKGNNERTEGETELKEGSRKAIVSLKIEEDTTDSELLATLNHELTLHVYPDFTQPWDNDFIKRGQREHAPIIGPMEDNLYHDSQIKTQDYLHANKKNDLLIGFTIENLTEIVDEVKMRIQNYEARKKGANVPSPMTAEGLDIIDYSNAVKRIRGLCQHLSGLLPKAEEKIQNMEDQYVKEAEDLWTEAWEKDREEKNSRFQLF